MLQDKKIDEIDEKLDKTEDYEIIINLLYQKVDLLEEIIGKNKKQIEKLKNQNKLALEEHEERFNEFEAEIEKKDKIIEAMTDSFVDVGFYSESFECVSNNENCLNDCHKHIKQYFEKKVEE